jgi:hypothetical protein
VADKADRLEACTVLLPPEAEEPDAQQAVAAVPDAQQEVVAVAAEPDAQQEVVVAAEPDAPQQAVAAVQLGPGTSSGDRPCRRQ